MAHRDDVRRVTFVTAFFRLRDRVVDECALFRHFDKLASSGLPIIVFLDQRLADLAPKWPNVRVVMRDLESLWTFQQHDNRPLPGKRTLEKDTREFLLLQNAKLDLLSDARELEDSTHFAWIDFSVMKVVHDADRFFEQLREIKLPNGCVLAPGCWNKDAQPAEDNVNWRFCGGFLLVDRDCLTSIVAKHHEVFAKLPLLTWEVNVWAEMEREGQRFDWYKADHDDSLVAVGGSRSARICLVMIVKNESAIIERCIASAFAHIDSWVIADTGSSDETPGIIERFFERRSVPGKLLRTQFLDFAQARNEALDAARASSFQWDYALLIDADMVLQGSVDKTKLTAPAYRLMQHNGNLSYCNTRLVRRDAKARYIGVTHEFLSVEGHADLPTLAIVDKNDGGSKGDKAERDIRLLRDGLAHEPNNERYMFYLANTYRETGQHLEAIEWYTRRIQRGGWDEEIWSSYYGIARSYLGLEDERNLIKACFDAYNFRPTRGEPLKLLAKFFREKGRNDSACLVAEALANVEYPNDQLFVERDVYSCGADEEIAISAFYSPLPHRRKLGYRACADLTLYQHGFVRNEARRNFTHYVKSARELFGADVRPIDWRPEDGYAPMNPSVCIDQDGRRLVLVRTVNYVMQQGHYPTIDGGRAIRTRNHLVEMDADWKPVSSTQIMDATGLSRNDFPVEGFEDCRLWTDKGEAFASATVRDLGDGRCEMAILSIDEKCRIVNIDVMRDYEHDKQQKNWMPINVDGSKSFVYLCDPTIVIERTSTGTVERSRRLPKVYLGDQRGGSQLIEHAGGWLCVTHEVVWRPERVYLHRFVMFDRDFRVVSVTDPFFFTRIGVEFCAGLARDGGNLVASFGVNDSAAHVAIFDPARIDRSLRAGAQSCEALSSHGQPSRTHSLD
jgi:glycosyltransferase involved in cell wall biosynthesis